MCYVRSMYYTLPKELLIVLNKEQVNKELLNTELLHCRRSGGCVNFEQIALIVLLTPLLTLNK